MKKQCLCEQNFPLYVTWCANAQVVTKPCKMTRICGETADVFGDHMVCCHRNNFYGRHYAVQEAFATMDLSGGQPFVQEAPMKKQLAGTQGAAIRPADLLLRAWQEGKDLAVDVTTVHPLQVAQVPLTKAKAEAFLKQTSPKCSQIQRPL